MVTLRELVNNQVLTKETDLQIIKTFFELNDLEENGIDIISDLTKSKINKAKTKIFCSKHGDAVYHPNICTKIMSWI